MNAMSGIVFTIGHSTHDWEPFLAFLKRHGVTVLCDVRSHPYSRRHPHFNREVLHKNLDCAGMEYLFLGRELGGRPEEGGCLRDGRVVYELLADSEAFRRGLKRVCELSARAPLALMCAEKEPLHCHRAILVARRLVERGIEVRHILADGAFETHQQTMDRLLGALRMSREDMFLSENEIEASAYRIQGAALAHARPQTV